MTFSFSVIQASRFPESGYIGTFKTILLNVFQTYRLMPSPISKGALPSPAKAIGTAWAV